MAEIPKLIGMGLNRRRIFLLVGAAVVAGVGAIAALQLGRSRVDGGSVTLRSRTLDYEKSLQFRKSFPRFEEIRAEVTPIVGEYFYIGMSYEEFEKAVEENSLTIDGSGFNERDTRVEGAYYDVSISVLINIPTWHPLVRIQYLLFFGFKKNKLDNFSAARVSTGP